MIKIIHFTIKIISLRYGGCVNNDINGNPLYKFMLSKNFESVNSELKGLVHRCYISKGYSLIQSYNIAESINTIINKIEK